MTARLWVAAAVVAGFALPALADDTKLKVKEGDAFPDVPLSAAQVEKATDKKDAKTVSIGDLKGKTVVLFFYPKANTGG
jgi:thioredoxin-dependent peroxiredoxin